MKTSCCDDSSTIEKDDLHVAVELSHLSEARRLLVEDHSLVYNIDANGDQPLHVAVRFGCPEMVRLLIQFDGKERRLMIFIFAECVSSCLYCSSNDLST